MFMRDPCVALYDRVVVARMATSARKREPFIVAFALRHSPASGSIDLEFAEDDASRDAQFRSLEGGDVLVLSPKTLMIGCSDRTSPQTIERIAEEALFPDQYDDVMDSDDTDDSLDEEILENLVYLPLVQQ